MEERLIASDISRYKLVRSNWFAYNPMRLNIGSIARWEGDGDVLVSPDYVVFRCLERSMPTTLLPEYLDSFRGSWQWETFVNEAGDGGVRIRIYYRDLAQLRLALPGVGEQQKIADCLGSLDDLIAAEGRKLEALRQHKQGLMQQLFPQPGETVPELRFPEFRDGEWVPRKLRDVLALHYGMSLPTKDRVQGEFPVYGSNGIVGTHNEAFVNEQGIVIGRKGSAGHVHLSAGSFCPIDTTFYLTPDDAPEVDFHFLYFLLMRAGLEGMKDLGSVPGLNRKIAYSTRVLLPLSRREQQKIAECLGSLDGLIAAEGRKLEALQQHKKGLMQQLFPSGEEGKR